MFGLGLPEIIIIFVIALIVFGPKKLPDLGKSIGRAMAEFKRASDDFQETVRTEMKDVEKSADIKEELRQIEKFGQGLDADVNVAGRPADTAAAVETKNDGEPGVTATEDGEDRKEHDKGSA